MMVSYAEHESGRKEENLLARYVIQDKVGLMPTDESWAELPGDPSSQFNLTLTFKSLQHPSFCSPSPCYPSLLGSCDFWTAFSLGHSSLGSGSDDLCNCEPSPSFRRCRMGGGHPGTLPAPCWWGSNSPRMLNPYLGHKS